MSKIAEVIVSIKHKSVDRPFDYAVPPALRDSVCVGMRALVPFGNGDKLVEGYILRLADETDTPPEKLKSLRSLPDAFPLFSREALALADWMRTKYYTTLADCLRCIMPTGIALRNEFAAVAKPEADGCGLKGKSKTVFEYIAAHGGTVAQRELTEQFGATVSKTLRSLHDTGLIELKQDCEVKDYALRVQYALLNDTNPDIDKLIEETLEKGGKQASALQRVLDQNGMAISDLCAFLHISRSPVETLAKNGILRIETVERLRKVTRLAEAEKHIVLTDEQTAAIAESLAMLESSAKKTILLHGVTGSGKTEIYMRLIEHVIARGQQAIMLVPEISLTPQTIETFTNRFGDAVTFTHSRLSLGERFDQWKKARDGQVSVMIGPRSAIFTPFANLGAIVIDEEHESTYKSETTPKYDVKELAQELSRLTGCLVMLGSATPDVITYYKAQCGDYALITLKDRVNRRMPDMKVVDMRFELADGNRSIFSRALSAAIAENLHAGEQTILFMNRRGHSTFVSCRRCGYVMACDNCSINYTYHIHTERLMCHYCGHQERTPENCPICGSKHIRYFGVGTQKIVEELQTLFPEARVLRMDMDTTSRKNSHESIINEFASKRADILVGTQMIAKGLNFPGVSLVGIVAADVALHAGDYRAAETAYQLITQVSGRAGRAELPGRVLLQTYNPEHYSIAYACEQNYEQFYAHEIKLREQMAYPPFSHLAVLLLTGSDERKLIITLNHLSGCMHQFNRKKLFEILGPAPATVSKIKKTFRWKLLVKGADEDLLKKFVFYCLDKLSAHEDTSGITVNISIDPAVIV